MRTLCPLSLRRPIVAGLSVAALIVLAACARDGNPTAPPATAPPPAPPTAPPSPPLTGAPTTRVPFVMGASGADYGKNLTTDAAGNVYATGYFNGTVDFDPGPATTSRTALGITDLYLAKYDAEGALQWVTTMGGPGAEMTYHVSVDASGNLYLAGYLSAGTACGASGILPNAGLRDAFVARFDAAGVCQWAVTIGGSENDEARGFTVDPAGNVLVAGMFQRTADFDPSAAISARTSSGAEDVFFAKYTGNGALVWARAIGGTAADEAMALASDAQGNVYVGGFFSDAIDADAGAGVRTLVSAGEADILLAKYDAAGAMLWANAMGGTQFDLINIGEIVLDTRGEIIVSGQLRGSGDFDPGPGTRTLTSAGNADVFVARYLPLDGAYRSAFRFGGAGMDGSHALRVDAAGDIYLAGWITGRVDMDPSAVERVLTGTTTAGGTDAFVAKLTADGTSVWASLIASNASGATAFGMATGLGLGASGSVWITGRMYGTADFGGGQTVVRTSAGDSDIFVARFDRDGRTMSR